MRGWLRSLLMHKVAHAVRRYRRVGKRRVAGEVSLDSGHSSGTMVTILAADGRHRAGMRSSVRKKRHCSPPSIGCRRAWVRSALATPRGLQLRRTGARLVCPDVAAHKLWLRALEQLQRELTSGTES